MIEFLIDKKGLPSTIRTIKGHPMLAVAVTQAVAQWRWKPYRRNGETVELEMMIAVNFEPDFVADRADWALAAESSTA